MRVWEGARHSVNGRNVLLPRQREDAQFAVEWVAACCGAAGSVGSSRRQTFTVYGDNVNRAACLEGLAKELGETIVVDQEIATAEGNRPRVRSCGSYSLRGLADPVAVWSVPSSGVKRASV